MSKYRDQLEDWLKTIDVYADTVIDLGGGALPVKDRVKSWTVRDYRIVDNNVEGKFVDDPYDINDKGIPFPDEVDVVFCLEVFEYVYNPMQAIENISLMLTEHGTAYISFPFVYPIHNPPHADMLRYTEHGISTLLYRAGFTDWHINKRTDKSGLLEQMFRADGMHPAKGYDHSVYGYMVTAYK